MVTAGSIRTSSCPCPPLLHDTHAARALSCGALLKLPVDNYGSRITGEAHRVSRDTAGPELQTSPKTRLAQKKERKPKIDEWTLQRIQATAALGLSYLCLFSFLV